jgi:hypothetical protein
MKFRHISCFGIRLAYDLPFFYSGGRLGHPMNRRYAAGTASSENLVACLQTAHGRTTYRKLGHQLVVVTEG